MFEFWGFVLLYVEGKGKCKVVAVLALKSYEGKDSISTLNLGCGWRRVVKFMLLLLGLQGKNFQ